MWCGGIDHKAQNIKIRFKDRIKRNVMEGDVALVLDQVIDHLWNPVIFIILHLGPFLQREGLDRSAIW